MSNYEHLVGRLFTRNGIGYLVVKVHDATVVAAHRDRGATRRVLVPLVDVLDCLDADVIEMQLPVAEKG